MTIQRRSLEIQFPKLHDFIAQHNLKLNIIWHEGLGRFHADINGAEYKLDSSDKLLRSIYGSAGSRESAIVLLNEKISYTIMVLYAYGTQGQRRKEIPVPNLQERD